MSELSDDERNLLRYYAETERGRRPVHQHLSAGATSKKDSDQSERRADWGDGGRSERIA